MYSQPKKRCPSSWNQVTPNQSLRVTKKKKLDRSFRISCLHVALVTCDVCAIHLVMSSPARDVSETSETDLFKSMPSKMNLYEYNQFC